MSNSNLPASLGIKKVYRESPFPITLVLPVGAVMPSVVEVKVYYKDILQAITIPVNIAGLEISWEFSVVQLRDMVGKNAKMVVLFDGDPKAGNELNPTIDFAIPDTGDIVIFLKDVGDTRVYFTGDFATIKASEAKAALYADKSEETYQKILNVQLPGKYQGSYNVLTNTPNLSALVLTSADKGKFWRVPEGGAGTTSLPGYSVAAVVGSEFVVNNALTFDYFPNGVADGAVTRTKLNQELSDGVPETIEVINGLYPLWWNKLTKKVFIGRDKAGILKFVADLSRSVFYEGGVKFQVVNSLVGIYNNTTQHPSVKIPLLRSKSQKKGIISYDGYGTVFGRFDLTKSFIPRNSTQFKGKKGGWFGTSIPHGGSILKPYPLQIFEALQCDSASVNGSDSGSGIVWRDNRNYSLSATIAQLTAAIGAPYTAPSYENKIIGKGFDFICIDHMHNDRAYVLTHLGTLDSTDNSTFYGAYNTIINAYLADNPNGRVFLFTPPTRNVLIGGDWSAEMAAGRDALIEYGKYRGIPVCDFMSNSGFTSNKSVLAPDGQHPSEYGDSILATIGTEFLKSKR